MVYKWAVELTSWLNEWSYMYKQTDNAKWPNELQRKVKSRTVYFIAYQR